MAFWLLKFEYGIGFRHVFSPSKLYFDQTTGFAWCLLERRLAIKGYSRWSQNTNLSERYRQESDFFLIIRCYSPGSFVWRQWLDFLHYIYFASIKFNRVKTGLIFRFFSWSLPQNIWGKQKCFILEVSIHINNLVL